MSRGGHDLLDMLRLWVHQTLKNGDVILTYRAASSDLARFQSAASLKS
jgi:hypothetical protein